MASVKELTCPQFCERILQMASDVSPAPSPVIGLKLAENLHVGDRIIVGDVHYRVESVELTYGFFVGVKTQPLDSYQVVHFEFPRQYEVAGYPNPASGWCAVESDRIPKSLRGLPRG